MKSPKQLAMMMAIILGIMPAVSAAQARAPLPIREATPGLLAQAKTSPAFARLTAFSEFPGAQLVSSEIRQQGNQLVYTFDVRYEGRDGNEQIQIDATTGQIICVEYTVDRDPQHHLVDTAPPELVALVASSFAAARDVADETAEDGHVVGCRLRVEQPRTVYVCTLETDDTRVQRQALIDAKTGAVVAARQPG